MIYLVDGQCVYMHYTIYTNTHLFLIKYRNQRLWLLSGRWSLPSICQQFFCTHLLCEGANGVAHLSRTTNPLGPFTMRNRGGHGVVEDASDRIYTWLHYRIGIKKKHHVSPWKSDRCRFALTVDLRFLAADAVCCLEDLFRVTCRHLLGN